METTIMVLVGFILVREAWFSYTVDKLVNKLMSRDYYSYKQAEAKPQVHKVFMDEGVDEDLDHLNGIR